MISVMIVDDSGFMRLALKKMMEKHPNINIVAEASSADEAVRLAQRFRPDIITMDIEMPGGSGIDATAAIMKECPTAIIMVSSITTLGAEATIQALDKGAVDFIPKASSFVSLDIANIERDLMRKVHYWAAHWKTLNLKKTTVRKKPSNQFVPTVATPLKVKPRLIVIGASTGGPKVLPQIFSKVDRITVPIVIALHMPEMYTQSFARNMASTTGHNVLEGIDKMLLEPGMVVIAPGGRDTLIEGNVSEKFKLKVVAPQKQWTIHPSVNALFLSAVSHTKKVSGIILTGMGEDGLEGALEFNKYGLPVVAQDEESSLVYGMPRAIVESGLAAATLDVDGIASKINYWASPEKGAIKGVS